MALTREQKEKWVQEYREKIGRAPIMIWSNFQGINVAQVSQLRRQLRDCGSELLVVKNSLMQLALKNKDLPWNQEVMGGQAAVTFVYDNIASTARVVNDFARDHEGFFQIKGGLVGGKITDAPQVQALATMPSREILLAQVIRGVQSPINGFVGALAAITRGFMNVLNARVQQLEGSSS
ncbi:MAG: 50S ribosomal protein L10 [Chloroflexi bacterium RBG_13_56_8]|nr:MAG: 50S ribosomal protein L10 [Chloroflexi bacterium RBG_13_56_8]